MEVSGWFPISGWEIRCCLLAVAENAWLPQHGKQGRIPKLRTLEVDLGEWSWSWWQEAGDNWGHTTVITHSPGVVQWNILELETGLPSQAHHQHQQFLLEFSFKGAIQIPTKKWLDWCKSKNRDPPLRNNLPPFEATRPRSTSLHTIIYSNSYRSSVILAICSLPDQDTRSRFKALKSESSARHRAAMRPFRAKTSDKAAVCPTGDRSNRSMGKWH